MATGIFPWRGSNCVLTWESQPASLNPSPLFLSYLFLPLILLYLKVVEMTCPYSITWESDCYDSEMSVNYCMVGIHEIFYGNACILYCFHIYEQVYKDGISRNKMRNFWGSLLQLPKSLPLHVTECRLYLRHIPCLYRLEICILHHSRHNCFNIVITERTSKYNTALYHC